jgi:hypothetical protein
MLDSSIQIPEGCSVGVARAAEAMIRTLGGSAITLLFPVVTSLDQRLVPGLGLATQATEQIDLSPVASVTLPSDPKVAATRLELLIPGSAIFTTMAERIAASPQNLFDSALGVIHEGRLLRIESWSADYFADMPYLFHLTVQG